MQPIDRAQAQQRANDILVFQRELQRLDQEQAFRLEPAQARQLADYHLALLDSYRDRFDIDHDLRSQQLSLGMRVASFWLSIRVICCEVISMALMPKRPCR